MLRLQLVCLLAAVPSVFAQDAHPSLVPPEGPWNVLVILTDQHHPRMTGWGGNGFGGVSSSLTENLDRLADEGVVFDRAYCTAAQCSPSRYSLMTGLYPHEHGLRWNRVWEPTEQVTLPEVLRDVGYATATIGKHHFSWLQQPTPQRHDHGFDLVVDMDDYNAHCQAAGIPIYTAPSQRVVMPGLPGSLTNNAGYTANTNAFHPTGYWADQAIGFLEDSEASGRPFFCVYSHFGPHTPILPSGPSDPNDWAHRFHPFQQLTLPPTFQATHANPRLIDRQTLYGSMTAADHREVLSYYYGYIAQLDYNIGRVLDRLAALDLDRNTLVLFTSDHGEFASEFGCWTKGGGPFDCLTRVPLVARLPSVGRSGVRRQALVSGVDLMPTVLELTGAPIPDEVRRNLSGTSLLPLLMGEPSPPRERVFSEFGAPFLAQDGAQLSVSRTGRKFNLDAGFGGFQQLFELSADPYELVDLLRPVSPGAPALAQAERVELERWWGDPADHAPVYRPSGDSTARPAIVTEPAPASAAQLVSTHTDLHWLPSSSAFTQQVHLAEVGQPLQQVDVIPATTSSFNPGALLPGRAYQWRVDGTNAFGPRLGPVWTFTTDPAGAGGPGLAVALAPSRGAEILTGPTSLRWTPPPAIAAQRLILRGSDSSSVFQLLPGTQSWFDAGSLPAGVDYRWSISCIDAAGRVTEGTHWTFQTLPDGLPQRATVPSPRHLIGGLPTQLQLHWRAGAAAQTHEVYLGTAEPLPLITSTTGLTHAVQGLLPDTTYFWRVDTIGVNGTQRGWTWRFRTRP